MLAGIYVDSLAPTAVDSQISLSIAFEIEVVDPHAALDRLFEDGCRDKAFFGCPNDLRHADTDIYDFHRRILWERFTRFASNVWRCTLTL